MKHTFNLVLIAGMLLSLLAGVGGTTQNSGQALAQAEAPATPNATPGFQILELSADNYAVVDHDLITGDDRGGIATSNSMVFYNGDESTGRFALDDLSGGTALGTIYDTMVSDLKSGQVYLLGNAGAPVPIYSGNQTVSQLLLVDGDTGALTGNVLELDPSFTLNTESTKGMFAGYGRVVVYDNTLGNTWSIDTATGAVTSLPHVSLVLYSCENWAIWGMAEYFGGEDYLVYRGESQDIQRTRLSDGDTTVLASFTDISDMCSFSANIERGRWYFHYEGSGQFGGSYETLGYASASFNTTNGQLDGHVYVDGGTTPIEGVMVSAENFPAQTDASGYYTMTVPVGVYDVIAEHPMYETATVSGVEIVTDTLTTQDFYLTPRGRLFGYVTDYDNGFPLEATLSADDGTTAVSDPQTGFYEMYLDDGAHVVTATAVAQNYFPGIANVEVVSGEDLQEDFVLQAQVNLVPAPVSITLDWQTTGALDVNLLSRLNDPYDFEFVESDQGFEPQLELAGVSGRQINQAGPIALVSDDTMLQAITPVLDEMGLTYHLINDNDPNLYMADPTFLAQYEVIVWYESGASDSGRAITQGEHDAVEAWLQSGGRLLVTGYDLIGSPDDPLMADLVRSSTVGDGPFDGDFHIVLDHPITNGPYGVYPPGTALTANETDHDNATPDAARGAVAVAVLDSEPYAKIMATELGSGGAVVLWNGNDYVDDWLVGTLEHPLKGEDKGIPALAPASPDFVEGQNMFKNTLAWLATSGDVPWLGETPASGIVPALESLDVTLNFTGTYEAGVYQPGDYFADLMVNGDPSFTVPVVMTVLAGADMGKVQGAVLDNCLGEPVEAAISIAGGVPITETVSDPGTGEYYAWLVEGTYDFTFSAAGYISATLPVEIVPGEVQTLDVDLVPTHPCLYVQPQELEAWLVAGTEEFAHPTGLTLTNDGGEALTFEFFERQGLPFAEPSSTAEFFSHGGQSDGLRSGPGSVASDAATSLSSLKPDSACIVALAADDSHLPETEQLHATLDEFGFSWMDVISVGQAVDAGANTIIVRYGGVNLPASELDPWVFGGGGVVQMGDWPDWFPTGYTSENDNTPLELTVVDNTHPLTQGLPPSWTGLGFWSYDWSENGLGFVDDPAYPNLMQASYGTPYDRALSAEEYGAGKAAYIGFNTYGYEAGDIDKQVLFNALTWTGSCTGVDVPWVWESPITGTVAPLSDYNVGIYFTAVVTDPLPLGTYTATLGIKNNDLDEGTQLIPTTMYVVEEFVDPQVSFEVDDPACLTSPVGFTNTSVDGVPPVDYFVWEFGDGVSLTVEDFNPVSHVYAAAGVYEVTLTGVQKQTGAEFTFTQTVQVLQPVADFTYSAPGLSVAFTNTSRDADTFLWDFGDGVTSTDLNPVHVYAAPDTYQVTLTATGVCGVGIKTENIPVDLYKVYQPLIFKTYTLP
jgi:hypothetical protein